MIYRDKLKEAMERQNLNAHQLSKLSGISNQSLSGYLLGKNKPTARNRQKLNLALGVTVEEIEDDTENKSTTPKTHLVNTEPRIVNAEEASKIFGIKVYELRELAKSGKFAWAVAFPGKGKKNMKYRFSVAGLANW
jgi:transcriptional regulator with XRE-family HTH domain